MMQATVNSAQCTAGDARPPTVQSFRDLEVWKRSMELALTIYRLTQSFPAEERYGLIRQMRRCAVSIPSNIAEGQGRLNRREFRNFLGIARGSNCELPTQMELASALHLGESALQQQAERLADEVGRMLFALIKKLGNLEH